MDLNPADGAMSLDTEVRSLRAVIAKAIDELDAEHYRDPNVRAGCVLCFPVSPGWPCVSQLVADDLRRAIWEGS